MHIHECIEIKERNLLGGEEGIFHLDLLKLQNPNRETSFGSPDIIIAGERWMEEEVGNLEYTQVVRRA